MTEEIWEVGDRFQELCEIGLAQREESFRTSFGELLDRQSLLMKAVPHSPNSDPRAVAILGLVEEALELYGAWGCKPWRPIPLPQEKILGELVDILFFYLELCVLAGFGPTEIWREYHRKYTENLTRYRKGAAGDFSWDKRGEGL